jgi:hypothetical protein
MDLWRLSETALKRVAADGEEVPLRSLLVAYAEVVLLNR